LRQRFEPALGHSFSRVRVHDDSQAARSADAVSALAYTVGEHIVFGSGQSDPVGRDRTWAHELAHVVQQQGGGGLPPELPIGDTDSPGESAAREAAHAATTGQRTNLHAERRGPVLQRQPKSDGKPTSGTSTTEDNEPTPWLTLQAQGLAQFSQVYTVPQPPPWLVGGQLAANFQFHSGKRGFELAIIGQYGRILTLNSVATAPGDQGQIALQPSFLIINAKGNQLALFGQGAYGATSSKDPNVAGQQYSLVGGVQYTRNLFELGPVQVQGVASLGAGGVWAKGPNDDKFSGSGTWQIATGLQFSLDVVKRKKPSPPPEKTVVTLPEPEPPKKTEEVKKNTEDEQKKKTEDEAKKKAAEDAKKDADKTPAPAPLPSDAKIFFLQDKPLKNLPDDKQVIASDMGGADLKALKSQIEATFAADPSARVAFLGYASVEGPDAEYNCSLGTRRVEWLRKQLGIDAGRVSDPTDKSFIAGNCQDDGGLVSFGSTQAANTKVEADRKRDRFVVVHFHRK
jgi:hypothetical protein